MEPISSADPVVLVAQQRLARKGGTCTPHPRPGAHGGAAYRRPDLGRQYDDGELVDINHVPAEVIASELGIRSPVAEDIVVQRTRVGDFNSVDDLVVYCEAVTPHQVTVVRDRLLFTPI